MGGSLIQWKMYRCGQQESFRGGEAPFVGLPAI